MLGLKFRDVYPMKPLKLRISNAPLRFELEVEDDAQNNINTKCFHCKLAARANVVAGRAFRARCLMRGREFEPHSRFPFFRFRLGRARAGPCPCWAYEWPNNGMGRPLGRSVPFALLFILFCLINSI